MAKKVATQVKSEAVPGDNLSKWGKGASGDKQIHLPSGVKLIFEEDDDCILMFLGAKDISDKIIDKNTGETAEPGSVLRLMFHDGKKIVSTAMGYALSDFKFKPRTYYYLHVSGLIDTGQPTKMKDFEIAELGEDGETVPVDANRVGESSITLTLPVIGELNYSKFNYGLRKK